MRAFIGAAVLSTMLAAAPSYAQAPAAAPQQPATPAPAAAPQPAAPFPAGTKYALINIQRLAAESAAGKAATSKVQALQQQRLNELNERNKQLQALQQQLEQGANVLSLQAATELQRKIERAQLDLQRFTEDAQDEVNALTQQLQAEFEQQLAPVITAVAQEKQLHMIFSVTDAGMIWWDPSLDITTEVINRYNATQGGAAAAPAAPAQPAAAPAQVPARP